MSDFTTPSPDVPASGGTPQQQPYGLTQPQPPQQTQPPMTPAQRLRAAVLGYEDLGSEVVAVPQWGGTEILVRGMSVGERNILAMKAKTGEGEDGTAKTDVNVFYPLIVIATCTEPTTGEPVFAADDSAAILGKSGGAVDLLATTALRLSGLDVDKGSKSVELAKEEAAKTSS